LVGPMSVAIDDGRWHSSRWLWDGERFAGGVLLAVAVEREGDGVVTCGEGEGSGYVGNGVAVPADVAGVRGVWCWSGEVPGFAFLP
jgi:hypothetical protein